MKRRGKILSSLTVVALSSSLVACETDSVAMAEPNVSECTIWEWEHDEGAWECEDPSSEYDDYYYANGHFYPGSSSKAIKSKSVKKAVDKVTKSKSDPKVKASKSNTGLGSGSKGGFGG